jgi:hypothetical protein
VITVNGDSFSIGKSENVLTLIERTNCSSRSAQVLGNAEDMQLFRLYIWSFTPLQVHCEKPMKFKIKYSTLNFSKNR